MECGEQNIDNKRQHRAFCLCSAYSIHKTCDSQPDDQKRNAYPARLMNDKEDRPVNQADPGPADIKCPVSRIQAGCRAHDQPKVQQSDAQWPCWPLDRGDEGLQPNTIRPTLPAKRQCDL